MNTTTRPSRFALTLAAVLIGCAITGGACSDDDSESNATRSVTPSSSPTPSVAAQSEPVITVGELQIQFTVPDTLGDLTVTPFGPPYEGTVGFSTSSLEAMGQRCASNDRALGAFHVGGDQLLLDELVAEFPNGSLYYNRPQGPCSEEATAQDLQSQQIDEFWAALTTVTYIGPPHVDPLPSPQPANVVTVEELQIKFTVPPSLSDLTWTPDREQSAPSVSFSTRTFEAMGPYCNSAQGPIGRVRISEPDPDFGEPVVTLANGNLYYFHAQATCSEDTAVQDLQTQQNIELRAALATAVYVGP